MVLRITFLLALALSSVSAQPPDPAYQPLEHAYQALRDKNYDQAIASFDQAIALSPDRASIRKDLAYTLLKVGENEAARDQFGEAMRLDPADQHVALEYAFLCYETKQQAEARRIFDRIRKTGQAPRQGHRRAGISEYRPAPRHRHRALAESAGGLARQFQRAPGTGRAGRTTR